MKPGTLIRLQTDAPWAECAAHCADVHTLVRPKRLPETFPYPQLDSSERRIRPAYYYRQSSVVPWCERDGELQVLVMGSSKAKHWVIPKGIHDPGFSAQESAAHEAFEEAGVAGTVLDRIMTTYSYPTWDATCEVAVYAMHVTRELADSEWQERHRGRRWLPVAEAAALVLNEDVGRAIRQLPAHLQAMT
jgi:phosphohistidine phosphatase